MFGKTVFFLKTILFWGFLTATLVEAGRQKKDVHHMIFLNESRKPSKSHRFKDHVHHDYHVDDRPKKSRKKHEEKKHKEPISMEESVDDISSSYEEFVVHKPKSKRYPQQHTSQRHHKRHNSRRHQSNHKTHHKDDHHNQKKSKPKHLHNLPLPDNWLPISSQEFFGNEEQIQYYQGTGLGQQAQGYIQSIPLEITTPQTLQSLDNFPLQSTIIHPSVSFLNQKVQNSPQPQPPLKGTVEPYKPFDYSVLQPKLQSLKSSGAFQEQEVASSNIVTVKHSGGKKQNPFSVIVVNSRENLGSKEVKQKQKEKIKDGGVQVEKNKKVAQGGRIRGGARYRIRSKN